MMAKYPMKFTTKGKRFGELGRVDAHAKVIEAYLPLQATLGASEI